MKPLLSGKEIIKTFGAGDEKHKVLNEVSVEIESGEFVSVMGPSGSGKSTLLYALSGMDGIDGGEVIFEDQKLSALSDDALSDVRRNLMGFVFQQPTLLKNMDILDNIILPQTRNQHRNTSQLISKARLLMKQMGIESLEHREITQVSGGQLQRAGICRALMSKPKIIFCDEPTGALNTKTAKEIMELFAQINHEGTAILWLLTIQVLRPELNGFYFCAMVKLQTRVNLRGLLKKIWTKELIRSQKSCRISEFNVHPYPVNDF